MTKDEFSVNELEPERNTEEVVEETTQIEYTEGSDAAYLNQGAKAMDDKKQEEIKNLEDEMNSVDFWNNKSKADEVISNLNMDIHKCIEDTYKLLEDYFKGLEEKVKFPYAILNKDTGEFIGVFLIKLDLYDEDCFEFTIYLDEKYKPIIVGYSS